MLFYDKLIQGLVLVQDIEVDERGSIFLKKTGEVTIYAKLYTGAEYSFVLHVRDHQTGEKAETERLVIEEDDILMDKDGYYQLEVSVYPADSSCDILYASSDESIVTIDYFGVMHALKEGTAQITVSKNTGSTPEVTVNITVK